jgi:hypothetical protein
MGSDPIKQTCPPYPAHLVGISVPAGPRIRYTADRDGQPYLETTGGQTTLMGSGYLKVV